MKRVIRLSESDLTRIIRRITKKVENKNRTQNRLFTESDMNRVVKKVLKEQLDFGNILQKGVELGSQVLSGNIGGILNSLSDMGLEACKAFASKTVNPEQNSTLKEIIDIIDLKDIARYNRLGQLMIKLKPEEICFVAGHIKQKNMKLEDYNLDLNKIIDLITKNSKIQMY